jgi:hypothetical protein
MMRDGDRLEGPEADRLVFRNATAQETVDDGPLITRQIFGVSDHGYSMTELLQQLPLPSTIIEWQP